MDDSISRQAAIDFIDAGHLVNPNEPRWSDNEVVNFLKSRPSVTPKPHWIPCSERLPEVGTYALVSKKPLGFRSNLPNVCMAHRSRDPRSGKEEWNDMLFGKLDDDDVLAWMPLPEPYKERREE